MTKERALSRRTMLVAGAAAMGLGAGVAAWRYQTTDVADTAVQAFWAETFVRPDGQSLSMSSYKGRPLLVNFWATWCPPCVEEMPLIDAFFQENKPNVQVLGLAVDRADAVASFLGNWPVAFDIALAGMAGTTLSKTLGNPSGGLPFSVFINKDGRIGLQKVGKLEESDFAAMKRILEA